MPACPPASLLTSLWPCACRAACGTEQDKLRAEMGQLRSALQAQLLAACKDSTDVKMEDIERECRRESEARASECQQRRDGMLLRET